MTFYAKPTNRPLALEEWFEKPKNRLFGHVKVNKRAFSYNGSKSLEDEKKLFCKPF
jgi:hypothetical protein